MSVQAGIWNFDGRPVDPALIIDFSKSLEVQGPDGESLYLGDSITLLYRPFHTTAGSRSEKQPCSSRRGFILTWDGRLDNREDLSADLRSDVDNNPTDAAIVAAAFDRWGTDFFPRIVGDWALCIWNPELRELIFATDYMAVRHIFYCLKENRIYWSSDLSPLVLLSPETFHIDEDYIAGYFAHNIDSHLTPYREIREVPAGHFARIRHGGAHVERYWRFNHRSRIRYKTDSDYEEHFRHVFRQAVRRRLRSDSPILAELSGGLDSSSIVCMADDILATGEGLTPRLDTLSYYDNSEPHGDDWNYFQIVERQRGRTGHHIDASKLRVDRSPIRPTNFTALPGHLSSERALEDDRAAIVNTAGYRVVISGIGGDEFMGGIQEAGATHSLVFVVGDGGSGKSVLAAQYLQNEVDRRFAACCAVREAEEKWAGRLVREWGYPAHPSSIGIEELAEAVARLRHANPDASRPILVLDLRH